MDKQEVKRVKTYLKTKQLIFPNTEDTTDLVNNLAKKIKSIDKSIFRTAEKLCQKESQELLKYGYFDDNLELNIKPKADEVKYERSLLLWQGCLQDLHKDFARLIHEMDGDMIENENNMKQCFEDCTVECMGRSSPELTNCQINCFDRHSARFKKTMENYNHLFGDLEKNYQAQDKLNRETS